MQSEAIEDATTSPPPQSWIVLHCRATTNNTTFGSPTYPVDSYELAIFVLPLVSFSKEVYGKCKVVAMIICCTLNMNKNRY